MLYNNVTRLVSEEVVSILEAAEDFTSMEQHVEAMRSYSMAVDAVRCLTAIPSPTVTTVGAVATTATNPASSESPVALSEPALFGRVTLGDGRVTSLAELFTRRAGCMTAAGNTDMAIQVRAPTQACPLCVHVCVCVCVCVCV